MAIGVGSPVGADAQSVIWSNPWTVPVAPWPLLNYFTGINIPPFVTAAVAANGDALTGGVTFNQDFRIDRIARNGDIRWTTYIPNVFGADIGNEAT
jgi:hypothetical protein